MPRPGSVVPKDIPTLHLYRHLLREVTYLPPAFSSIIANHVRHYFHQHARQENHLKKRLSRARSALRSIKAANHGSNKSMSALISQGFGRVGKRRRQLVSQFVIRQGPNDSSSLEALLEEPSDETGATKAGNKNGGTPEAAKAPEDKDVPSARRKYAWMDRWDKPKLLQFLSSQRNTQELSNSGLIWEGKPIKTVDENSTVPAKNSWGKPPSEVLVRAKQAKWWKRHADKIYPPVGKGEWELLQKLSNGAQERGEWKLPQRRTPAKPLSEHADQTEQGWDWEAYATNSTAFIERKPMVRAQRLFGETDSSPYIGKPHRNTISDRWFRRAYAQIFQKTSYMEQDPNTLRYKFTWGTAQNKMPAATERQQALFEGVDTKGRRLRETPHKPAKL